MGKKTVKNYPSPRLMETIGATNQKPSEAIGELVANSFDARLENEKMTIIVDMRGKKIVVTDNGKGMTSDILEKAVCIAEDMSKHIERGESAKGHFGMGFKTSCSTLGGQYEIFTRPCEENREYYVKFDISDYSNRPSGADAWDIEIEDRSPSSSSPLCDAEHGTAFLISELKDKNITNSAVLDYLGEAFTGHLKTGDSIKMVDDSGEHDVIPKEYSLVKGSKIHIDTSCGPKNKYRITGWMGIDSQIHNDGLYGFNIYRKNQLVEKWDKSWFRAHLMTSRIIGEVNMDFLDATFYKQGIQRSEEEWIIASSHMKEYLKPLVSASSKASKKGNINKPRELKKIIDYLRSEYGEERTQMDNDESEDNNEEDTGNGRETSINNDIKTVVTEKSLVLKGEGEIKITYLEKEKIEKVKAPFDYIFAEADEDEGESSELQVIMFKDHPLWENKTDYGTIRILATSDGIYRVLVEKLGFDTSESLKIRNEWVWNRITGGEE